MSLFQTDAGIISKKKQKNFKLSELRTAWKLESEDGLRLQGQVRVCTNTNEQLENKENKRK